MKLETHLKNRDMLLESRIEEIIGVLWIIASMIAFLNDFNFYGGAMLIKGFFDIFLSTKIAIIAAKQNTKPA